MIGATIPSPDVDFTALAPPLALLLASFVCLLGAVLVPRDSRRLFSTVVALAGFVASAVFAVGVFDDTPRAVSLLSESMVRDRLAAYAQVVLAVIGALVVLVAYGNRARTHVGEFFALVTAAGAGMSFWVSSDDLLTSFLGLEWFSIALYILCAIETRSERSLEAGLKYLIVGSFGSAVLLFGSALVYGATGELGFDAIRIAPGADEPLFVTGMALILAGLAFKVSAAPFHMWTPDVYEGAPTTVTAFMAAATKTAAIVVMYRLLVTAFPEQAEIWTVAVAVLAVLSLAVGNAAALVQRDVKRMLAYSSVSQAGFLLIAVAADNTAGGEALLYFLVPYTAATVAAFGVIAARERELGRPVSIDGLAGLGWERPLHGVAMWVAMLSFAGFPLTGGFLGKFTIFSAIYEAGWWWLVVIGVIATAISIAYYMGIVRALYMRPSQVTGSVSVAVGGSPPRDHGLDAALVLAMAIVVGSFFFVQPIFDAAEKAIAQLPL